MFVFFIQAAEGGLIKISSAQFPKEELKRLQVTSPVKLEIIGFFPGRTFEKRFLHERFKQYRQAGEWFEPCDELLNLIQSLPQQSYIRQRANLNPMLKMYIAGYTLREIGRIFGVSRQRIYQVLSKYNHKKYERYKKPNIEPSDFYYNLIGG